MTHFRQKQKPVDLPTPSLHAMNMKIACLTQKILVSCLSGTLVLCFNAASLARDASKPVVMAYYALGKEDINHYDDGKTAFPVAAITATKARMLTHLNFSFLTINEDGQCALEEGTNLQAAGKIFRELQGLKKYNVDLRLQFSIGGWAYTNDDSPTVGRYHTAAATAENRKKLAQSCVHFMREYGFDGLDLDWEYPRAEDAQNFVALLKEMRLQLKQAGKTNQLSIAVAGGAFNMARTYLQLPQIAAQVDYVNLMSYDFNGAWEKLTNHNAHLFGEAREHMYENPLRKLAFKPTLTQQEMEERFPSPMVLTVDATVQQYLHAGVPASKLVMGLPFYGRAYFQVEAGENHGLYQTHLTPVGDVYAGDPGLLTGCDACTARKDPRTPGYGEIKKLLAADLGYQSHFSNETKVPWIYNVEKKIFISYDDGKSFAYKIAYLKKYKLAGAMFWHLGQDDDDASLLRSLYKNLHEKTPEIDLAGGVHY
ncbi:glycoside hydrolase family 18 protein [Undibacterium sp. TJN19]|uniref:glycoside hydrolase family 18 protein n=1 Tax=Undibacterium sp. TJN19 TaxID=3413055 RepID=UPI003BF1B3B3